MTQVDSKGEKEVTNDPMVFFTRERRYIKPFDLQWVAHILPADGSDHHGHADEMPDALALACSAWGQWDARTGTGTGQGSVVGGVVAVPGIPVEHDPKTVVIGTDAAKRELDEEKAPEESQPVDPADAEAYLSRGPEGCSPRGAGDYMVTVVLRLYEKREGALWLGKSGLDQPRFWTKRSGLTKVVERADLGPGMVEVRMHRLAALSFGWA